MKNKIVILSIFFIAGLAQAFNPTNASWDEILFNATRYGSTEEKRASKEQARQIIFEQPTNALRFVLTKIHVENVMVQVLAQELIEKLKAKQATPILLEFIDAEDPMTRKMAVYFLGFYDTPKHAKKIIPLLDHEKTRGATIRTLGKWRIQSAAAAMTEYVHDPKERIRVLTVNALRDIGDPQSLPVLIDALNDPVFTVRNVAECAIASFGKNAERPLLNALSVTQSVTQQRQIIRCLGQLRSRKAIRPLRHLLKHKNPLVRQDAANALEQISNR